MYWLGLGGGGIYVGKRGCRRRIQAMGRRRLRLST